MDRLRLRRQTGVTLIELMVAMVLGLLVVAGIATVFTSTSHSHRVQTQLARLQEEGRFAIARISADLRMANGQYCASTGDVAQPGADGTISLDGLRAPKVHARNLTAAMSDVTTMMGTHPYPAPAASYTFPSFLSMRGYDCGKTSPCTPANPPAGLPAMGTWVGKRVVGASVITVRYVDGSRGWAIGNNSTMTTDTDGTVASITLAPGTGEPPIEDFAAGDLAMLADCSNAQIFAVNGGGTATLSPKSSDNYDKPLAYKQQSAPRLFDFNSDFLTVTYYLKVISTNDDGQPPLTGALMRRVNGGPDEELLRGIERLNFRYGVEDANGHTRYLTAAQVDASTSVDCPPSAPTPLGTDPGCLWRAVKTIEVSILMSGQEPLHTLNAAERGYTYAVDGITTPQPPSAHAIKPSDQGFADAMIRREFTALISVRNYNP
ncbi:PilW family protein [Dyella subtropica]|uniref:PilW family protein n=1 Tax=Dyella subtropica TaxID=2992127 RepID=UPI002252179F|nr:PilW family protein [Dyella subtropica]